MRASDKTDKEIDGLARKQSRAWRRVVKGIERFYQTDPAAAKTLWRDLSSFLDATDATRDWLNEMDAEMDSTALPKLMAGLAIYHGNTERREMRSKQQRQAWNEYQAWIDEHRRAHGWCLAATQRKAAKHFKVSLKTIQRRTA